MYVQGAGVVADTITSFGPVYHYKGGSGPEGSGEKVRHHPLTAHMTIRQSGRVTASYGLVRSM